MSKIALFVLLNYKKYLSPALTGIFGNACRFTPTCSEYTIEALEKYGTRGLLIGIRRFLKCHPFGGSGWDPVK